MADVKQIKLLGFVKLVGQVKALSGLHIGGTADAIDKGGIDSPVIKNPVTNQPYIPGSSLRGRMRSLLEKRDGACLHRVAEGIHIEAYEDFSMALASPVCRLFGNSASDPGIPSALIVRDAQMSNTDEYMDGDLPKTEAKLEIVVDRVTGKAQPRTIERVPAGAIFNFEMIYKVQTQENGKFLSKATARFTPKEHEVFAGRLTEEGKSTLQAVARKSDDEVSIYINDLTEEQKSAIGLHNFLDLKSCAERTRSDQSVHEDLNNILWALETIEKNDGLGGNTSRGHGSVTFVLDILEARTKEGDELEKFQAPATNNYADWKVAIDTISFADLA